MSRRLLLMECARRKRDDLKLLPAIERYDGPSFRVLRRYLRNTQDGDLDIFVISAQFGLIAANDLIPNYDQFMTRARGRFLRSAVSDQLLHILSRRAYQVAYFSVSASYRETLPDLCTVTSRCCEVQVGAGSQGRRLADLHKWLYQTDVTASLPVEARSASRNIALRGYRIRANTDDVLNLAHKAAAEQVSRALDYRSWYVPVDGARVSPKWLVSQLIGVPVNGFHSLDARRVLAQLGIEVRQA